MELTIKIIQFFLCFTILVGIHELGHFFMARLFRIRVDKFYIFFDPWFSLFKFQNSMIRIAIPTTTTTRSPFKAYDSFSNAL